LLDQGQDEWVTTYDLAAALAALPTAHRRLEQTLRTLTDDEARGPSELPGWTRGHVVSHVARHGEASARTANGLRTGVPAEMYPGGAPARLAGIEAGAGRPAAELAADVAQTSVDAERAFAAVPAEAWDRIITFRQGELPAARMVWSRWREVEIHHVDLGLDRYTIADWPAEFVDAHLPHELARLADRAPAGTAYEIRGERYGDGEPVTIDGPDFAVLAWLVGRPHLAAPHLTTPAPNLPNWG
jgi:maleylpyruvate isomerase